MESLFGVPLAQLDLEHVAGFLEDAGSESILWEAKGRVRPEPASIQKQVSGFANRLGGYLIIGAERRDDEWVLDGVDARSGGTGLQSVCNSVSDRLSGSQETAC